ncbi:DUF397 domain-containing protein [Nocardia sp. NPDC056611]|uniref:DUF397 domain-containing protein n=1 Tax=Nocardia sp. NPDC056611 TaxID=3345877 RepID=UPI0036728073
MNNTNTPEPLHFFKSSYSESGSNCVEVAWRADGGVAVRDSKNPTGPVLNFTPGEWDAFMAGAGDGEFHRPNA